MPLVRRMRAYASRLIRDIRGLFQPLNRRFLCDTCENDYGNACVRPERPNAVQCRDYRPRRRA